MCLSAINSSVPQCFKVRQLWHIYIKQNKKKKKELLPSNRRKLKNRNWSPLLYDTILNGQNYPFPQWLDIDDLKDKFYIKHFVRSHSISFTIISCQGSKTNINISSFLTSLQEENRKSSNNDFLEITRNFYTL